MLCVLICSCSLQALHKKLLLGETFQIEKNAADLVEDRYWHCDDEIMNAVWTMVRMCDSEDANGIRVLVSDFISRVLLLDICIAIIFLNLLIELYNIYYFIKKCRLVLGIHIVLFSICQKNRITSMSANLSIMALLQEAHFRLILAYLMNFWLHFWSFWRSTWWMILLKL